MFTSNSFGKTLDILHRTMDVTVLRRQVIADNIANSDTPHFKRSTVNFESELKRALESQRIKKLPARLSDPRHIPFERVRDYREVVPRKVLDYLTTSKNNGNNVDLEEEMMLSLSNQLNYDLLGRVVANQFSQLNIVLR